MRSARVIEVARLWRNARSNDMNDCLERPSGRARVNRQMVTLRKSPKLDRLNYKLWVSRGTLDRSDCQERMTFEVLYQSDLGIFVVVVVVV